MRDFEERVAEFAGARYGVAVESCTAAIFLSCVYRRIGEITIPKHTYPGVACSILHAGGSIDFSDESWSGIYELRPSGIVDGALRFRRGMYRDGTLHCLSFHIKKLLPIGRGGMILTDDPHADEWFRLARFDGRHPVPLKYDRFEVLGWNMYMTPDQASRGIQLFELSKHKTLDDLRVEDQGYPDLSQHALYQTRDPKRCLTLAPLEERRSYS